MRRHDAPGLRARLIAAALGVVVASVAGIGGHLDAQAVVTGKAVVAFGSNHIGQLGNGTATDSSTEVQTAGLVPGVNGAVLVASGQLFGMALRPDGSVVSWGSNRQGELGDGTTQDRYSPVSVAGAGGSGVLTGVGCPAAAPSSCVPLAGGDAHGMALKPDGSVLAWGNNDFGQLGDGTTTTHFTPVQVMAPGSGVVAIAAGGFNSMALKSDGTVLAWGGNQSGQLGNGTTNTASDANPSPVLVKGVGGVGNLTGITAIGVGSLHSLALKADGTVLAWGSNQFGQLGNGTTADSSTPVAVSGLGAASGVTAVSAGGLCNVALKGGGVVAWGSSFHGELGTTAVLNGRFYSTVPVDVMGVGGTGTLTGITAVAASKGFHVLAIRADGTVVSWGFNQTGQLGNGATVDSHVPVVATGVAGATSIAGGSDFSLVAQTASGPAPSGPSAPGSYPGPAPRPAPIPVAASATPPPRNTVTTTGAVAAFNTPVMAADPVRLGHLAIAYGDGNSTACYLSLSADGGRTWNQTTLVGPSGSFPIPQSITDNTVTFTGCYGQSVAYGPDGALYYLLTAADAPNFSYNNIYLMRSSDGSAAGFGAPKQLDTDAAKATSTTRGNGDSTSGANMAFDTSAGAARGELYVAFVSGPNRGPAGYMARLASCTTGQLATFAGGGALACTSSVQVNPANGFSITVNAAYPAVGPDGVVYVAWLGQKAIVVPDVSNPGSIELAASTDHGMNFGPPSQPDLTDTLCPNGNCLYSFSGPQGFLLSIAAGTAPGKVYVGVSTRRDGFAGVTVSASGDGGANWASRRQVGRIAGSPADQQHGPQLSVAPNGRLDVGYYDTAPDGSQHAYVMSSIDGGLTYSAPQRLSSAASDENIMLQGFPTADTDFGLVSTEAGYYAAWADSRNGTVANGKLDIVFATDIPNTTLAGVVGGNDALYTKQGAQEFQPKGGILLAAPAVVAVPGADAISSPLYVGVGGDHRLYVRNDSATWQDLMPTLVDGCFDSPGALVTPDGAGGSVLTVACRGGDQALYTWRTAVSAGALPTVTNTFQPLGGKLLAGPAVALVDGVVTYFAEGLDHVIYTRTAAPNSGYTSLQAACIGHPAAANSASGLVTYAACQGLDGALYYSVHSAGAWSPFRNAGGQLIDGPGIAISSAGVTVFVEGLDQAMYRTVINLAATSSTAFAKDGGIIKYGTGAAGLTLG